MRQAVSSGANFNRSIAAHADASPGAALQIIEMPMVFLRRSALIPWRLGALADDLFSFEPFALVCVLVSTGSVGTLFKRQTPCCGSRGRIPAAIGA